LKKAGKYYSGGTRRVPKRKGESRQMSSPEKKRKEHSRKYEDS